MYERDIVALINQKKRTWSSRAVRSRHTYGAWLGFECLFDCVAVVSEAILKPNDLTRPDIGRHSLTCVHRREVANYRYLTEYSGIESRLVELITRWSHLSRLLRSRCPLPVGWGSGPQRCEPEQPPREVADTDADEQGEDG